MAYSEVPDLLIGDFPLGRNVVAQKWVDDAADEIDSRIGRLYATPINVTDPELPRHTVLTLKRINNNIASGRLIMFLAAGEEENSLHAYGRSLFREGITELMQIVDGTIVLDGLEINPGLTKTTAPTTINSDSGSAVDAFYDSVMTPTLFPEPILGPKWTP